MVVLAPVMVVSLDTADIRSLFTAAVILGIIGIALTGNALFTFGTGLLLPQ
jgi:hypothetical protein